MAMKVTVKGKHGLEVTDGLREHAEQRLHRLEKYFQNVTEAIVMESVEGGSEHRVEVTLLGDNLTLRGEERTSDMYASVDRVVEKLEQRLKKYKVKHSHLRNHHDSVRTTAVTSNGAGIDGILPAETPEEEDTRPRIVRTKAVTMKPMSIDDAVRMLELTDHEWFVYLDQDTQLTQVVYRRRDGNYALVVPKI
jgi:putative sigma-54 modulation protein